MTADDWYPPDHELEILLLKHQDRRPEDSRWGSRSGTRRHDAPLILDFIHELAEYERLPTFRSPRLPISSATSSASAPRFCQIAECDGAPAGFALWFYTYSTFLGRHGIWLEDLFVRAREPTIRGVPAFATQRCPDRPTGLPSLLRGSAPDEQVFEPDAVPAEERGISGRTTAQSRPALHRTRRSGRTPVADAEEVALEIGNRGDRKVGQPLVLGQLVDEVEDQRRIVARRVPDREPIGCPQVCGSWCLSSRISSSWSGGYQSSPSFELWGRSW